MISSISLSALSTPPASSTSPIRDVRATERLAPANSRVLAAPNGAAPSPQSPRGSILNLSV